MNIYEMYGRLSEELTNVRQANQAMLGLIDDVKAGRMSLNLIDISNGNLTVHGLPAPEEQSMNGHAAELPEAAVAEP